MSTRVGTLQGSQKGRSIWPTAILASLVMLTIALAAVSLGRDHAQTDPKTTVSGIEETFVGGTTANTPTELSGGIVGGIAGSRGRSSGEPVYLHGRNLQGLSPLEPVYMHGRNLRGLDPITVDP